MADEAAGTETKGKKKAEVEVVKMEDGREVGFAGKRKMVKETLIDDSKVIVDGNTVTMGDGAVTVRLNFRNGKVLAWPIPAKMVAKSAGHGGEQKLGDEAAGEDKIDDMILGIDDLIGRLSQGEWTVAREAGGFSGASIVIKAICEASGKGVEEIKVFLQKKLDAAAARGEKLSRKDLYDSFRNPNSKTGQIIERLEREERSKAIKVDADAALAELG